MSQADINDHEPGLPLKVRRMAGGAMAVLIAIVAEDPAPARDQLILRWEPNGQLFAALLLAPRKPKQP